MSLVALFSQASVSMRSSRATCPNLTNSMPPKCASAGVSLVLGDCPGQLPPSVVGGLPSLSRVLALSKPIGTEHVAVNPEFPLASRDALLWSSFNCVRSPDIRRDMPPTMCGARHAGGSNVISKYRFISDCKPWPSTSFSSAPNGSANSTAMRFSIHRTKTWMNEKSPAHTECVAHCDVTSGATNQCRIKQPLQVLAYCGGNAVVAKRRALWYCTMPFPSCWKTLVSKGAGVVKMPFWVCSMMWCCTHP
mmetsp:Transcript_41699/g.82941  ORF Transcript_41699/g.82941 Transcript_41699/m.82941 type:complete len:249 (-) Transcript_41699:519-1265(-)